MATNGWDDSLEKLIIYYGDCSRGYIWMLTVEHRFYSRIYWWISNVIIGCAVVASALNSVGTWADPGVVLVISNILMLITAFLTGVVKVKQFETTIYELKRYISKYVGLVGNIRRQMALPADQREPADQYIQWVATSYDGLCEICPDIRVEVQMQYQMLATKEGLVTPDDISNKSQIHGRQGDVKKTAEVKISTQGLKDPHGHRLQDRKDRTSSEDRLNAHEAIKKERTSSDDRQNAREDRERKDRQSIDKSNPVRIVTINSSIDLAPGRINTIEDIGGGRAEEKVIQHDALEFTDARMSYELDRLRRK